MPATTNARAVVELACRAPSVHNTQPWAWRIEKRSLLLFADRSRQLTVSDPDGRNLLISCGAALHHAEVAARGLGLGVEVHRFPDSRDPDLLARFELAPGRHTPAGDAELEALESRLTDRRRFTSWPVPPERLQNLCDAVVNRASLAVPLTEPATRFTVERLIVRARVLAAEDDRFAAEQQEWVARTERDGVPATHVPDDEPRLTRPSRFADAPPPEPEPEPDDTSQNVQGTDGVIAVVTRGDGPAQWLDAGEALSTIWLRATRDGVSVVPLSEVIELAETREALHHEVFAGGLSPQILLRVGWQGIAREPLAATPRRPLDEVLRG
jgi:hypothetical protein